MPTSRPPTRSTKPRVINDGAGSAQFKSYKFKSGKRKPKRTQQSQLISAITVRNRLRFSGINELSQGQGYFPLSHQFIDANIDHLPVFVMNLSSVRQASNVAQPLWRLWHNKTTSNMGWTVWNGLERSGGLTPDWQIEDNASTQTTAPGRKALLDWVRIRLNVWGKKTAPSRISIQLVKFSDEELCPETMTVLRESGSTTTADVVDPEANQFWSSIVKPLINNPCSSIIRTSRMKMRVIKDFKINIDPTLSNDNDPDPSCKFLDIFHRVGRLIDYSSAPSVVQSAANLNAATTYTDITTGYRAYPQRIQQSLYLVIRSMQQDYVGSGGTMDNTQTATFDMNVQTSYKSVQAPQ